MNDGTAYSASRWPVGVAGLLAVAVLAWAWTDGVFRDAAGSLDAAFGLPVAIAVAALVVGATVATSLRATGAWIALALVGQALTLQLIEAGSGVGYQHYRSPAALLVERPLHLVALALQTLAVTVAVARRARAGSLRARSREILPAWRWAVLVVVGLGSSAIGSWNPAAYAIEIGISVLAQLLSITTIALAVASIPSDAFERVPAPLSRLFAATADGPRWLGVDRTAWFAAGFVAASAALLGVVAYERVPHLGDEYQYLFQARIFASGALALEPPPVPLAFNTYLMESDARGWHSVVPPGWPAALAIGVRLGGTWWVNPILAGLAVVLTAALLRSFYDARTTRLAVLLLAVSPWHLFLGMSLMPHPLTLVCALSAALAVERARHTGAWIWPWLGGAALGWIALTRQLDGLVTASLIGLWSIGVGGKRLRVSGIAGLVLGCALVTASILAYNAYFTGSPTKFPLMVYVDQIWGAGSNAYGFGPDRGMGWPMDPNPGHGPVDGLINTSLNVATTHIELFGWGAGSLWLAYFLIARFRFQRGDQLMLSAAAAFLTAYFFNYFSGGPDFGARYWYLTIVPLVALSARGARELGSRLPGGEDRMLAALVACVVISMATFIPWRALDKYHRYRGIGPEVAQLAAENDFGRSLVLIRGDAAPDYLSAAIQNPLDLRANQPVYAWDRDPAVRAQLIEAYPDRPIWLVEGPKYTGAGFEVVAGPVSAAVLSRELAP